MRSPVERLSRLSQSLGIELLVKRDDLLAFPLAGNKVRKLFAELSGIEADVVVTNGAITSNHCRTLAIMAAQGGFACHLVLHGAPTQPGGAAALKMLADLGARVTIALPSDIRSTISEIADRSLREGRTAHIVAGGCHTPAGARAYYTAAGETLTEHTPDVIVVASGTGATQGGIVAAAHSAAPTCRVVGFSVARSSARGLAAVAEAAVWAGAPTDILVDFRDSHLDGGYGLHGPSTDAAVRTGWRQGLPLDYTYTGKAFAGLLDLVASGEIKRGEKVLFWHTGGLGTYLAEVQMPFGHDPKRSEPSTPDGARV